MIEMQGIPNNLNLSAAPPEGVSNMKFDTMDPLLETDSWKGFGCPPANHLEVVAFPVTPIILYVKIFDSLKC